MNVPSILNFSTMKNTIVSPRASTEAKKRIAAMLVAGAVAANVAGCGGGDDTNAEPPVTPGPTPEEPVLPPPPGPVLPPPDVANVRDIEAQVGRQGVEIADVAALVGAKSGTVYVLTATKNDVAECLLRADVLVLTPKAAAESPEVCTTKGVTPEGAVLTTEIHYTVDTLAPRVENLTVDAGQAGGRTNEYKLEDLFKNKVQDANAVKYSIDLNSVLPHGVTYNRDNNNLLEVRPWVNAPFTVTVNVTDALGNVAQPTLTVKRAPETYTPPGNGGGNTTVCPPGTIPT